LNSTKQPISLKKRFAESILWIGFSLLGVYNITNGFNAILFFILSGMLIEHTAIDIKVSYRKISRELIILLITIVLMIIVLSSLMILNSLTFEVYEIIRVVVILVVYGIIEFLMKKWQ